MGYVHFDSSYAPCAFLLVKDGGDPYNEADSILIQTDWDYPGVARNMGFSFRMIGPADCGHSGTDGTITCPDCGMEAGTFIGAAADYIREHAGEKFEGLDEYFETR